MSTLLITALIAAVLCGVAAVVITRSPTSP
jgi:hypothetical protein